MAGDNPAERHRAQGTAAISQLTMLQASIDQLTLNIKKAYDQTSDVVGIDFSESGTNAIEAIRKMGQLTKDLKSEVNVAMNELTRYVGGF